jgi:hypothetical protein
MRVQRAPPLLRRDARREGGRLRTIVSAKAVQAQEAGGRVTNVMTQRVAVVAADGPVGFELGGGGFLAAPGLKGAAQAPGTTASQVE